MPKLHIDVKRHHKVVQDCVPLLQLVASGVQKHLILAQVAHSFQKILARSELQSCLDERTLLEARNVDKANIRRHVPVP